MDKIIVDSYDNKGEWINMSGTYVHVGELQTPEEAGMAFTEENAERSEHNLTGASISGAEENGEKEQTNSAANPSYFEYTDSITEKTGAVCMLHYGEVGVISGIHCGFKRVYDIYPKLKDMMTSIGNGGEFLPGEAAKYTMSLFDAQINFNPDYFGRTAEFYREIHSYNISNKEFPVGTDWTSVVDHETAHLIDQALSMQFSQGKFRILDGTTHFSYKLKEQVLRDLGISNTPESIKNELSNYANASASDFMAEALREYTNSVTPRRVAQAVGSIVDEHMDRDWTVIGADGAVYASMWELVKNL